MAATHVLCIPHFAFGGLVPNRTWLWLHLLAGPITVVHWHLNRGVCVLTNLESWLGRGVWWDGDNPEQGGWSEAMFLRVFGRPPPPAFSAAIPYVVIGLGFCLSAAHLHRLS